MDMDIFFPGGLRVDAEYKGFTIKTDQPEYSGGDGSAPAPFQLFLASMGTCAGIFVLFFCKKRDISTEGLKLVLRTEKNKETRLIAKVNIEIQLPPHFPEKYKDAVVRSAEMCTVKRNILDPPEFEICAKYIKSS